MTAQVPREAAVAGQSAETAQPESFFAEVPGGIDIARYFWHETDHRNPGCNGIDLYREGSDYCYLWVEAMVDLDMWEAYLLDVRTHVDVPEGEIGETRDYLFVFGGAQDRFDVEWHNQPIDFAAETDAHRDRFHDGMTWFISKIEKAIEDAADRAIRPGRPTQDPS